MTASGEIADASPVTLDTELLDRARERSENNDVPLVTALQDVSGWDNETVLSVLGRQFGYPCWRMTELLNRSPDFDILTYTECVHRGVLWLAPTEASPAILVLSDPFDEASESWALR
ncbi:MAG: hypothetical protein ACK5PF_04430, partial [bacterium]